MTGQTCTADRERVFRTAISAATDAARSQERRTFEVLAAYWPRAGEAEQVIAKPLNTKPKCVASTTLTEPLEWENSRLLLGDVARGVAALKEEGGGDLLVVGSTELVKTLVEHDLADELRLMIDPLVIGGGKRIFRDDGLRRPLALVDSQVTSTRAIIATYAFDTSAKGEHQ